MDHMKAVTVSIIVHNDFSHIRLALRSLVQGTDSPLTVYLTINSGKTDEIETLQAEFSPLEILVNHVPQGFAENHNRILRLAETEFVLVLNDDIEAAPHMIDKLMQYMEEHQEVGLVSPRVVNPDGTPQLMAFSDPSLLRMIYKLTGLGYFTRQGGFIRNWIIHSPLKRYLRTASLQTYRETQFVPVVVGVAMCVRRRAYQQAGLMDEDTRVYGEEYGWHWRLRQHGWKIALFVDTFVTHFNVEQPLRGWILGEHRKGMLNYYLRYRPKWQARVLRVAMFVLHALRAMLYLIFDIRQVSAEWKIAITALTFQPRF
jgi:GT2 family glycosyltransferase